MLKIACFGTGAVCAAKPVPAQGPQPGSGALPAQLHAAPAPQVTNISLAVFYSLLQICCHRCWFAVHYYFCVAKIFIAKLGLAGKPAVPESIISLSAFRKDAAENSHAVSGRCTYIGIAMDLLQAGLLESVPFPVALVRICTLPSQVPCTSCHAGRSWIRPCMRDIATSGKAGQKFHAMHRGINHYSSSAYNHTMLTVRQPCICSMHVVMLCGW